MENKIYERFAKNLLYFTVTCEQRETGKLKEIAIAISKFTDDEKISFMDYITSRWLDYFESIFNETYKYIWFTEDVFMAWSKSKIA